MKKYYVTLIHGWDETVILKTDDKVQAIKRAQDERYYIERDKRTDYVEIRMYTDDIESDDCECFDYNTLDF